jgi:hypothetical protein
LWPFAALPVAGFLALFASTAGFADDRPGSNPEASSVDSRYLAPKDIYGPGPQDDRMIRYEVRYLVGPPEHWRPLFLPRMKLVKQEADFSAWLLDDKGLYDLVTQVQANTWGNVLSAPRCGAVEGTKAIIVSGTRHQYIAGYEDLDTGAAAPRPVQKDVQEGTRSR